MDQKKQVEVSVVLGHGDFSLCLNGVTISVRVQNANGGRHRVHLQANSGIPGGDAGTVTAALPEPGTSDPTDSRNLMAEVAYYRQASQEIYEGLGKLAKEINTSL